MFVVPTITAAEQRDSKAVAHAVRLIGYWGSPQAAFTACDQFLVSQIGKGLDDDERAYQLELMQALVGLGAANVSYDLLEVAV